MRNTKLMLLALVSAMMMMSLTAAASPLPEVSVDCREVTVTATAEMVVGFASGDPEGWAEDTLAKGTTVTWLASSDPAKTWAVYVYQNDWILVDSGPGCVPEPIKETPVEVTPDARLAVTADCDGLVITNIGEAVVEMEVHVGDGSAILTLEPQETETIPLTQGRTWGVTIGGIIVAAGSHAECLSEEAPVSEDTDSEDIEQGTEVEAETATHHEDDDESSPEGHIEVLPFTGIDLSLLALIASFLAGTGVAVVRMGTKIE